MSEPQEKRTRVQDARSEVLVLDSGIHIDWTEWEAAPALLKQEGSNNGAAPAAVY